MATNHGNPSLQGAMEEIRSLQKKVTTMEKERAEQNLDSDDENPVEHLMAVGTQIAIIGAPEHLRCKLLSGTLKDVALRCEATVTVSNPNQEMFVAAFHNGLKAGHFNESLAQKPATSMQEVVKRASCYIKGEGSPAEKRSIDAKEKDLRNNRMGYLQYSRYPADREYTSLNRVRVHVLHEILQAGLAPLPPPRMNNTVMGPDTEVWCAYHRCKAHDTERNKGEKHRVAVNTISGGFAGGGESNSARKHYVMRSRFEVCSVGSSTFPHTLEISFNSKDGRDVIPHDDDPLVIQVQILNCDVKRVLIDSGRFAVEQVVQRKRKVGEERRAAITEDVAKLKEAGFIEEIKYLTWLANVVMVKKANGKWRMCVDFTNLNKACPKDPYSLPNIDRLIDGASGYRTLSFMDAYSGYNQIKMHPMDAQHTMFMSNTCNYFYNVMPFGLKNAGATYQRMMDRVFVEQIGKNLEVYIDDMAVKTQKEGEHDKDLDDILKSVRKYNMRLSSAKCSFGVQVGKFLGFLLTHRGIEANPYKCQDIINMKSPTSVKEVQQLMGRISALSSPECEEAFQKLKVFLASPPILTRPEQGKTLYLYLAVSEKALSSALVQEVGGEEKPIYFMSRTLRGAETRYQNIERLCLAVIITARKLRQYFQSHQVVVKTDYPLKNVQRKPDLAGRMVAWSVELSEFDITYIPRGAIKFQALADFVLELTDPPSEGKAQPWTLSVDGSSNLRGSGAGVVLEGPDGVLIEQSLRFAFKASNNQAKYEALIAGMKLAKEMEVQELKVQRDSQLVANQVSGELQTKDPQLAKYLEKVKGMAKQFAMFELTYVPREQNARADLLAKLASTKKSGNHRTV
ncbi:hypothetical protein TSUD_404080 [Trifolium subterraneum]|uniref:RNase H type-1 domain-containing protein n=1 Tax=Trifolium subterraneum TaxID=3900 RepID=A0A2Z6NTS7_TRISU|nr:hypothetical protein TSUD_404080 [Trifolium subterraneum]